LEKDLTTSNNSEPNCLESLRERAIPAYWVNVDLVAAAQTAAILTTKTPLSALREPSIALEVFLKCRKGIQEEVKQLYKKEVLPNGNDQPSSGDSNIG
jgi:hypothetical protein